MKVMSKAEGEKTIAVTIYSKITYKMCGYLNNILLRLAKGGWL